MKLILIIALFTTSLFAMAQTEPNKDQEAESASRRLLQKKRERMVVPPAVETTKKEENKEEQVNDDADPELDAIDDDMTEDEGINDD